MHEDNKWTGVLMSRQKNYFDCLDVDERGIQDLFEDDHKFWLKNLQQTKNDVAKKQRELE